MENKAYSMMSIKDLVGGISSNWAIMEENGIWDPKYRKNKKTMLALIEELYNRRHALTD